MASAAPIGKWFRNVVIPYTASASGGIMLALGRALGETMAGDVHHRQLVPHLLVDLRAGHTIAAAIASEFAESDGSATSPP